MSKIDQLENVEERIKIVKQQLLDEEDEKREKLLMNVLDVLHRERKRLRIATGIERNTDNDYQAI